MAYDKNEQILRGNLAAHPDLKQMPNGDAVCTIRVLTNKRWRDRQTGQEHERVQGHRCVIFGNGAQRLAENLQQGDRIWLSGETTHRKWQDEGGNDRWTTEVQFREWEKIARLPKQDQPQPGPQASPAQQPDPSQPMGDGASSYDDDFPF